MSASEGMVAVSSSAEPSPQPTTSQRTDGTGVLNKVVYTSTQSTQITTTNGPVRRGSPLSNGSSSSRTAQPDYRSRSGEPQPKIMRTNVKPQNRPMSPSTSQEFRFAPIPRTNPADDEVQYNSSLNTILQYEKSEPEHTAFPEATSPARAAYLSRLDPDRLTPREESEFPEVAQGTLSLRTVHLTLRNTVLQLWLRNPTERLTVGKILRSLETVTFSFDQEHLIRIVKFLNRICLINFGEFSVEQSFSVPPVRQQKHVVVVGAGISGLAAARQLRNFGFKVTVLEGRNRSGGRISPWFSNTARNTFGELGSMLVTGTEGNPIAVILHRQLGLKLEKVDLRCPIFDNKGSAISEDRDEVLEQEFESLVSVAHTHYHNFHAAPSYEVNKENNTSDDVVEVGPPEPHFGVGLCITEILKLKELEVIGRANSVIEDRLRETMRLKNLYKTRFDLYHKAKSVMQKLWAANIGKRHAEVKQCREQLHRLKADMRENELLIESQEALEVTGSGEELPEQFHEQYISEQDQQILGWHLANYDFANAMPVENLSVEHWDQDEEYELKGGHYCVTGGLAQLVNKMSAGIALSHSETVEKISYGSSGATVTTRCTDPGVTAKRDVQCDAVILTVPLGVLKHAVSHNSLRFEPSLPTRKAQSIQKLGFGVLNKVILVYPKKFWKARRTLFGFTNRHPDLRGNFFMFWGLYDQPVLVALIAGKAAVASENKSDEQVVQECTRVLQKIFGRTTVSMPKDYKVSRWGSDQFSRGSYSSVPVGASGDDFDVLAEPLEVDGVPRVCFAGEHTMRRYPGTMHGALLSGYREATRIADFFDGKDNVY